MRKLLTNEYSDRIGHWIRTLQNDLYAPLGEIALEGFTTYDYLTPEEASSRAFSAVAPGYTWGHTWEYLWLRGHITLPDQARGQTVVMNLNLSGEATLFVNGKAFGTRRAEWVSVPHHYMVDNILADCAEGGENYDLLFEAYAGHFFPDAGACATGPVLPGSYQDPLKEGERAMLGISTYGIWREDAYQLLMDLQTLQNLYDMLPEGALRTEEIASALEDMTHIVDFEQDDGARLASYRKARERLAPVLAAKNGTTQAQIYAVGNAHLDLAWLWPMQETQRKTARTFAQQLRLLEKYPEYRFLQSQPASYEMCREHYPELYRRIQEAARRGQWIADGAMYVEPDTNMPCGEALIRQLVYGKRFFKEEFGVDAKVLWLPDTFGYSAVLPQLLKNCGVDYLVTQKIFWSYNDSDQFPYHYFTWKGLDGTGVISFLPTSYTYKTDPKEICQTWNNRVQKRNLDSFLMPFGYGDGGGGPCRDHIEFVLREKDLQGMPRVKMECPQRFFEEMEKKGKPVNTWAGELYFSAHRGTYTVQSRVKKNNRKNELWLRQMEIFSSLAQKKFGFAPDTAAMQRLWKRLLLHQFHDILPGSSIARVYEEANAAHQEIREEAVSLLKKAAASIADGCGVTFLNSLSWPVTQTVLLDSRFEGGAKTSEGEEIAVLDGKARVTVPPMGWLSLIPAAAAAPKAVCFAALNDNGFTLENDVIVLRFNALGEMVSYRRKDGTVLFEGHLMNHLEMYKDVPRKFDAWDIDSMYVRDPVALTSPASLHIAEESGLSACVEITRKIENSTFTQRVVLNAGEETVQFVTKVDWHELHRLLKVRFDSDILAENAYHETQFGYVERPVTRNNAYDQTRFEVCNHHYTALCDMSHGFAVLNDCKYGVSAEESAVSLTLLRAGASPEMQSDQGEHTFTYAFTAWQGSFAASPVVREGYELNQPLYSVNGSAKTFSACSLNAQNIILETVKPAEDGSGDLILRLYESTRAKSGCKLTWNLPFSEMYSCNMLEEPQESMAVDGNSVMLSFRPFEVKTLRIH